MKMYNYNYWLKTSLSSFSVEKILNELLIVLEMKPLTPPILKEGEKIEGWTGVRIIETSHIAVHCFDRENRTFIQISSCKKFSERKVKNYLKKYVLK